MNTNTQFRELTISLYKAIMQRNFKVLDANPKRISEIQVDDLKIFVWDVLSEAFALSFGTNRLPLYAEELENIKPILKKAIINEVKVTIDQRLQAVLDERDELLENE